MKTTRTRILMAVIAASLMVTGFMSWDDCERAFRKGYEAGGGPPLSQPARTTPPRPAPGSH
jgi:hypothetical protein